jgi:hypothetical protein
MARSELKRNEIQSRTSRASKSNTLSKSIEMILERINKRLSSKGSKGYLSFEKALRSTDLDQDSLVSIQ